MLLVDFTNDENEAAGNWCPHWSDVEEIVLRMVDTEKENEGNMVSFVRKIEERFAARLPKLPIARHDVLIHSYDPPNLAVEILDHDRPGWGPRATYRLVVPIRQRLLDAIVQHGLHVAIVLRGDAVTDIKADVGRESDVSLVEDDSLDTIECDRTTGGPLLRRSR